MTLSEAQRQRIRSICSEHGVARLAVFGSRARGEAGENSDLDLLVEFAPGKTPGFFGLAALADSLSEALGGLRVDLRTPRDLSHLFRDEVIQSAVNLYAA